MVLPAGPWGGQEQVKGPELQRLKQESPGGGSGAPVCRESQPGLWGLGVMELA